MKNLPQIAASFNLYQLSDIPATHKTEDCIFRIERSFIKIPEFLTTVNNLEKGLFYECREQDNPQNEKYRYYIEHSYILVKSTNSENVFMLRGDDYGNKGKYYFFPYYGLINRYNGISHHKKQEALKSIKEPNQIGVFTLNKVTDWINYCESYINIMDKLLHEVTAKNEAIKKQIADFIKSLPGCTVSTYSNKTWIETPLFQILFEHFTDQNYLSEKISFKGSLKDITNINELTQLV